MLGENGWDASINQRALVFGPPHPCGTRFASRINGIELRSYQLAAVQAAMELGRAVVHAPTGSGKTEMGAELIRRIGQPTLWVVHRADLLSQTAWRLEERLGVPVGVVGGGKRDVKTVTVGMVQTLSKICEAEWWRRWQVLVLDECHHGSAETWMIVASRCTRAAWRYGLSGTPLTGNALRDAQLEGVTGPMIETRTTLELADMGFLARPRIVMLRPPAASYPTYEQVREAVLPDWRADPRRLEKMGGRLYVEAYERGVVRNHARTSLIADVVKAHCAGGEKVLVLCTRLAHGTEIQDHLLGLGVGEMVWLSGVDHPVVREIALRNFRDARRGAVLVASEIYREGIDIPEVDVAVLAGGGRGEIRVLQWVGRSLRPRPDKAEVLIYDVRDGRSAAAKKDYLAQHTAARLAIYEAQGFEVERKEE